MEGISSLVIGLNILCALFHFSDPATIHHGSTVKHVTTRRTIAQHHTTQPAATTTHTTTPRPTHERGEWSYNFYYYDSISHYLCCFHSSRVSHGYCLCYHVPYEHRADIHSTLALMKTESHMLELYRSGNHVTTEDLQFFSKPNYDMCHNHGKRPNVTIYMLYDN